MTLRTSPYLRNANRLADIIASIQFMGSYATASMKVSDWAARLGEPLSAKQWSIVFQEHPEFFRLNEEGNEAWAALRWRHAYPYHDLTNQRDVTSVEYAALTPAAKSALTRESLTTDQIELLVNTAINLHGRAMARQQDSRWWIPLVTAFIAAVASFVGAMVGEVMGKK